MLKRMMPFITLLLVPALAQASDVKRPAPLPPTIVIRLDSLDALVERLDFVGGLLDQQDQAKKLGAFLISKCGPKGLFGVDGKRPIGLYARVGADISDINGVVMVPVTEPRQFKEMLESLGWEVSVDQKGLYTVKQNLLPIDVQYRIANDYAYVGLAGMSTLEADGLLTPDTIFGTKPLSTALSLTIRLDQIPEGLGGMFLDVFKEGREKFAEHAGGTQAQRALCLALSKELFGILESVLKDGEELNVDFDIDQKTKQLTADVILTPKAGSKLAENIAKLGQRKTLFAGVLEKDAAVNGLINIDLPAEVRSALTDVILESVDKALEDGVNKSKKQKIALLFNALKPSLNAGGIEAAVSIRGPNADERFLTVAGFRVEQGKKMAATLIKLVGLLPERERKAIKLNADEVDGVAIHKIEIETAVDGKAKQFVGDAFVAFRDDAVFLAIGEGALEALKKALRTPAAVTAPLEFDSSLMMAVGTNYTGSSDSAPSTQRQQLDSRVRLKLEGGDALRLRFTMDLAPIKLISGGKDR
jgi:hypothetical protein